MLCRTRLGLVSVALVTVLALSSLSLGAIVDPSRVTNVLARAPTASGVDTPVVTERTNVGTALPSVQTIPVGSEPSAVVYDSENHCIYVANEGDLNVTVINGTTNSVVANIPVGQSPDALAYDSSDGDIYVANSGWGNFSIIDGATNSVVGWTGYTGSLPMGAAYDSSNGYIYATDWGTGNVTVISGDSVHSWITVGSNDSRPDGVDYDNSNGNIYVAVLGSLGSSVGQNSSQGYLSVINGATNSVVNSLAAGLGSDAVADSGPSQQVFVANYYSRNVSVINAGNGTTQLGSVTVGHAPDAVAFDPYSHNIFVANEGSNNVTVISTSGDHVVANLPVGQEPDALAYDSSNGDVYVADSGSSSVSVIATGKTYSVSFTETGVPSGADWSVTLNGTTESSVAGSNVTFTEPNGTYSFNLGSFPNYSARPSTGELRIDGANATVRIAFYPIYTVAFHETGLPRDFEWNVTLNQSTQSSIQANATFEEINGTYPFSALPSAQSFPTGTFYQPQPSSGNVTVDGSNVSVLLTFYREYVWTYRASGLPSGASWSMTVNGTTRTAVIGGPIENITFYLKNGTYAVTVEGPPGYSTPAPSFTLPVDGFGNYPAGQEISFTRVLQNVTFSDPALPSGTVWYVNLTNGQSFSTNSSTVTFQEPDGTYYFTIGSTNKEFVPSPSSGSFTVNGTTSVTEVINFSAVQSSAPPQSFDFSWIILAVVLVVVAIGVSIAMVARSRRKP
jgi:YVTN family beta-propeller protein